MAYRRGQSLLPCVVGAASRLCPSNATALLSFSLSPPAAAAERWASSAAPAAQSWQMFPVAARAAFGSAAGAPAEESDVTSGKKRTTQLSLKPSKNRKHFRRMWLRGVQIKEMAQMRKRQQKLATAEKEAKKIARWRKKAELWRGAAASAVEVAV